MKNWYDIISPHADIRKVHFDEAVFAADLGDVAAEAAPDDYRDPTLPYIKLATLHSDTMPALATEVVGKMSNTLWYLNSFGEAYYFSHIPNLKGQGDDPADWGAGCGGEGGIGKSV